VAGVVRPYEPSADERWATGFFDEHLGGRRQVRRGEVIDVLAPGLGFVAVDRTGALTYRVDGDSIELTAVAAEPRGRGTGTSLVDALAAEAGVRRVPRIWVVTTNDNLDALAFYERRGFRVTTVRSGAIDEARRTLKPAIPVVGQHGIEMHDEIELTRHLPEAG
jgi:ribosomal protein S18 acetylase RimI-like enzyme